MWLAIVFLIVQCGFAVLVFYLLIAFVTGAPFVPSTNSTAQQMLKLARIKPGQTVIDLGSGDGRLLRLARQKKARAIGLEINPLLVLYSKLQGLDARWKNFWTFDLSQADVLCVYLLPWRMDKLEQKILTECKEGTIVVSNSFLFPNLKLIAKDPALHVFVYQR